MTATPPLLETYQEARLLLAAKGWVLSKAAQELAEKPELKRFGVSQPTFSNKTKPGLKVPIQPEVAVAIQKLKTWPGYEWQVEIVMKGLLALHGAAPGGDGGTLAPEGVFEEAGGGEGVPPRLSWLPPPEDEEVEALLRKVALRAVALLRRKGKLEEAVRGEDALDFLRAEAVRSPPLPLGLAEQPSRRGRRCAFLLGGRSAPTPACAGRFPSAPYRTRHAPFVVHRALHR